MRIFLGIENNCVKKYRTSYIRNINIYIQSTDLNHGNFKKIYCWNIPLNKIVIQPLNKLNNKS